MTLTVVVSGHQDKYIPDTGNTVDFSDAISPEEVMEAWEIPEDDISVVTLDGIRIDMETPIRSSGVLRLFPGILGG